MNPIATIKAILDTPAQTLKATELLTVVFTGRVLPDSKQDKEKPDAKR